MKRIYILRHAKSDYPSGVDDKQRPLSERGIQEADLVAKYIADNDYSPDFVYCSAATRAQMTYEPVSEHCIAHNHDVRDDLYLASAGHLYETAKQTDDKYFSAMFIGHNPGMHNFALFLTQAGDPEHIKQLQFKYPTACLTVISFDVESWSDIAPGSGQLEDFMTGKKLR